MKTFSTTIYDLRGRHLIHVLGMALGLFLVAGYAVTFGRLIDDLIEWKKYGALITFILLIAYGLLLLVPKGMIEKRGEIDGSAVIMYVYTHMEDVYPGTQSCGE